MKRTWRRLRTILMLDTSSGTKGNIHEDLNFTVDIYPGYIFNSVFSSYQARKAGRILMVSTDGYYDQSMCAEDFKKASYIVKKKTGKKCVFITDHSPIHKAMGEDALNASKMNKVNILTFSMDQ